MQRCGWVNEQIPIYVEYHDTEWGVPIYDPRALWEQLCLEAFQAGLSWITILRKREAFRAAFAGFVPEIIATFNEDDVTRLMADPGIVRSRSKILATIEAAKIYQSMEAKGENFSDFIWSFVDGKPVYTNRKNLSEMPTFTPQSQAMSLVLKKKGFKFCGPVICYAFMQAAGLVFDHEERCHLYQPAP